MVGGRGRSRPSPGALPCGQFHTKPLLTRGFRDSWAVPVRSGVSARRTFRPCDRLTHAREFDAVYAQRMRQAKGPLALFARANALERHRLGLAVSRRVGTAPMRNRIKRLIREAFRLGREEWPPHAAGHFDYIVSVRPHTPRDLETYQTLLVELAGAIQRVHNTRGETRAKD